MDTRDQLGGSIFQSTDRKLDLVVELEKNEYIQGMFMRENQINLDRFVWRAVKKRVSGLCNRVAIAPNWCRLIWD